MGLKDKARRLKKGLSENRIDRLEEYFDGKVMSREELLDLKNEILQRVQNISGCLEKKVLDLETLIEICEEFSSHNEIDSLANTIIRRISKQFARCSCSIFLLDGREFILLEQKNQEKMHTFSARMDFIQFLTDEESAIPLSRISDFGQEHFLLEENNVNYLFPLRNKGILQGFAAVGFYSPRGVSDTEKGFLNVFSSIAAIFLENARKLDKLNKKALIEPFSAVMDLIQSCIQEKASFQMLRLNHLNRYIEFHGSSTAVLKLKACRESMLKELGKEALIITLLPGQFLLTYKKATEAGLKKNETIIYKLVGNIFAEDTRIDINPTVLTVSSNETSTSAYDIYRLLS